MSSQVVNPIDRLSRVHWLYHFTDASNLASIREHGGLWSTVKLIEKGIKFRSGGNQISLDADKAFGMDKFVHLSFTNNHPMAYLASHDGRIEKLQWLYIENPFDVFELPGVLYCPEVSNKSGATLYDIGHARQTFDYEAIGYLNWKEGSNYARRVAVEKCEILVPDHLPLKYFEKWLPKS